MDEKQCGTRELMKKMSKAWYAKENMIDYYCSQ